MDNPNNYSTSLKLHRQFVHPSQEKLLKLTQNGDEPKRGGQECIKKLHSP